MSQADLVADLKASLQDAADTFGAANDADFKRHLDLAAADFVRARPRTMLGTLTLVADQSNYAAPVDMAGWKSSLWGIAPKPRGNPWDKNWPGRLPVGRLVELSGSVQLFLDPPPSAFQIQVLGADFRYYYYAKHSIAAVAASTTVRDSDRGLLLLRAQAEAMRELAMRAVKKPVALRDGLTSSPRNGTPAALWQALMEEFDQRAGC